MINVATIMIQLQQWLEDDPAFHNFAIKRSELVNEDPGLATNGWLGIYRRSVDYDPRNLGIAPNNYEGTLEFVIIVQRTSLDSGANAEDILEESVKAVLDRVVQLPKTYIEHFSNIIVEYTYVETDRKTMYFQGALITFTAEVSFEVK